MFRIITEGYLTIERKYKQMKNKITINWNLAARILSGEALENEINEFNLWLADSDNKKEWTDITRKIDHVDRALVSEKVDLEAAWKNVKNKTTHKPININALHYRYVAIAASIIIAFALFFNQYKTTETDNLLVTESYNTIELVELNDGSTIDINRNSTLRYPEEFSDIKRNVTLKGEAFFTIAADKTRPFIIEAGQIQVKVVGTSFNIKAYPESELSEVIVETGIVEVSSIKDTEKTIILYAGDRAIFNTKNNSLTKIENNNRNYIAWKTKEIAFKNDNLADAIRLIEQVYNVSIQVPKDFALDSAMITATFDKNTIDFIIEVINKTHSINLIYHEN